MVSLPSPAEYRISTDRSLLDVEVVVGYLARSYWAANRPRDRVETSLEHSLCFGLYHLPAPEVWNQVGFARVVSDYATFAYLADVFVLEEHRGRGLGKHLLTAVTTHPELQGLRRWILVTADAHGLYRQFGFEPLLAPERFMERLDPGV